MILEISGCRGRPESLLERLRGLNIDTSGIRTMGKAARKSGGRGPRKVVLASKSAADKFVTDFQRLASFNQDMAVRLVPRPSDKEGLPAGPIAKMKRLEQELKKSKQEMAALKKTLDKLSRRSTDPRDKASRFKRDVDVLCRYYEHGTCKRGDACNFAHQDSDGSADSDWVPPSNGTGSWADMDTSASEVESDADASSVSSHSSGWSAGSSWNNKRGRRRKPKKKKTEPKDSDQSESSGESKDNGGKDVKSKRAKRKRKAGKSGGSKGSGKPRTKNGPNNKSSRKNVCFSWRDTGVCETAGCRFVHA